MIKNNKLPNMYKILILIAAVVIIGCGDNPSDHNTHVANDNEEKHSNHAPGMLTLNNGSKWKLDESTRDNIAEIKSYISDSSHFNDYTRGYEGLKMKSDNLIKECRMSGPDHDALHVWLSPFLKDMERLTKPGEEKEAYMAVSNHLKEFDNYFE